MFVLIKVIRMLELYIPFFLQSMIEHKSKL